jgi:hypothetical protein
VTTLGRAKSELRIVSTKNDFDGGWLWSLPDHDPGDEETEAPKPGDA